MPLEMRVLKEKMLKEATENPEKADKLKQEEVINPWLITDVDYSLLDNPFSVETDSKSETPQEWSWKYLGLLN